MLCCFLIRILQSASAIPKSIGMYRMPMEYSTRVELSSDSSWSSPCHGESSTSDPSCSSPRQGVSLTSDPFSRYSGQQSGSHSFLWVVQKSSPSMVPPPNERLVLCFAHIRKFVIHIISHREYSATENARLWAAHARKRVLKGFTNTTLLVGNKFGLPARRNTRIYSRICRAPKERSRDEPSWIGKRSVFSTNATGVCRCHGIRASAIGPHGLVHDTLAWILEGIVL
mmetsp:Transcript_17974/g.34252  ORF Transcript_17974/g.34252 Transcript_17974/m.34252 type:complete len:227 (+) Transcript_17974:32-712(+)